MSSRITVNEDVSINTKINNIVGNKRLSSGVVGCGYDRAGFKAVIVTNDRCVLVYDLNNKLLNQKQLQFLFYTYAIQIIIERFYSLLGLR